MSRRDEVESEMKEALRGCDDGMEYAERLEDKCLLLADEVHAERAVVTKLLAMLNMNTKPRPKHEDFHPFDYEQWNDAVCEWDRNEARYTRALKIAGRTE